MSLRRAEPNAAQWIQNHPSRAILCEPFQVRDVGKALIADPLSVPGNV